MRKIALSFYVLLIFFNGYGQNSTISFKGGYAIPLFKNFIDGIGNRQVGDNNYTYSEANISLGKGISANVSYNHSFNDYFGFQLGFSYFSGFNIILSEESEVAGFKQTATKEFNCSYYGINPGLFFSYPIGKVLPFINIGFTIGKGKILLDEKVVNSTANSQLKWTYNGGVYIGHFTGVGADIILSKKVNLFTEVKLNNINYKPSKGMLTEAKENDKDILDTYTTSQKEIEFVESYTVDSLQLPDENSPSKETFNNFSCGNLLFSLGIRISVE
ncbi:hypothetical protein ACFLRZ_00250 [Bacteroidota bacterium]